MADSVDKKYIKAFKSNFIRHLADKELSGENNPSSVIADAKDEGTGKLSRVFGGMNLPVLDRTACLKAVKNAGGIDRYCFAMLKELSSVIMNEERTALNREVIEKGIGLDRYALLIGPHLCKFENGVLSVTPGKEGDFSKKELEIAKTIMSASLENYGVLITPQIPMGKTDGVAVGQPLELEEISSFNQNVILPINSLAKLNMWIGFDKVSPDLGKKDIEAEREALLGLIREAKKEFTTGAYLGGELDEFVTNINRCYEKLNDFAEANSYMNDRSKAIYITAELIDVMQKFATNVSKKDIDHGGLKSMSIENNWEDKKTGALFRLFRFIITFGMAGWYSKDELAERDKILTQENMRTELIQMIETEKNSGNGNLSIDSCKSAKETMQEIKNLDSKDKEDKEDKENESLSM